jgi:hypothetical protein
MEAIETLIGNGENIELSQSLQFILSRRDLNILMSVIFVLRSRFDLTRWR